MQCVKIFLIHKTILLLSKTKRRSLDLTNGRRFYFFNKTQNQRCRNSIPPPLVRRVSNGPGSDEHPSWSPDGRMLVYSSGGGGSSSLYLIPALGGTAVRLTDGRATDLQPDWGPMQQAP